MDIMEIVLLAAGGIIFILSFLIPVRTAKTDKETRRFMKTEVKALVSEELDAVRGHVDDVVEEAVTYSIEKTERSLERLSNEKIMAVQEYSDTVLAQIHKNHEEVMFLYDMLNNKHINLKDTVSEVNRTVKQVKETKREAEEVVNTFQRLAPENVIPLQSVTMEIPPAPVVVPPPSAAPIMPAERPASRTAGLPPAGAGNYMQGMEEQGQNSNGEILELYKSGKSPVAIAKELDLGVGEVKLVIDLYKNRSVR